MSLCPSPCLKQARTRDFSETSDTDSDSPTSIGHASGLGHGLEQACSTNSDEEHGFVDRTVVRHSMGRSGSGLWTDFRRPGFLQSNDIGNSYNT